MNAPAAYTVHQADLVRDRELILGLWRGNLGQDTRMAAKYDWFYRQCPWGEPLTLLLRHEASGEFVGVASAGPRRMRWNGRDIGAGVLVDLAVTPRHRSLGPALTLQMALMKAGARRFDLLYGFPNPKAAPVFKRVGYSSLDELTRYARVLRHGDYLRRRLPSLIALPAGSALDTLDRIGLHLRSASGCEWLDRVDADAVDALWQTGNHGPGPLAIRDAAFLAWRFDRSPLVDVRYLLVRDRQGQPLAWFACAVRDGALHVLDAWSTGGASGPEPSHLATLLRAARDEGHASVSIELSVAAATDHWQAAGFIARESRPVFGQTGEHDGSAAASRPYLTSADEDE